MQKLSDPVTETTGAAGEAFTVTVVDKDPDLQPATTLTVSVYTPLVVAEKLAAVAPAMTDPFLYHWLPVADEEVNVTLLPLQNVTAPDSVITGAVLTVTLIDCEPPVLQPLALLTVSV